MGSNGGSWLIVWIVLDALLFWEVGAAANQTQDSLNSFVYASALHGVAKLRTGTLYAVAPPANMSGLGISMVRLRANRLWMDGANFSSVEVPPRTALPQPFTRRIDIVYQNLGNWSAPYYSVPNHTLVAPVIAFLVYDSYTMSSSNHTPIDLNIKNNNNNNNNNNSIRVHFPDVQEDVRMKCVRFDKNGAMELSNVTVRSTCLATGSGHFSIVIPDEARKGKKKKKKFKGWMVGVTAGGIVGLGIITIFGYMLSQWRKMRKMERQAERSEGLGTIWIGVSRMPTASGIRTQPILENTYVP